MILLLAAALATPAAPAAAGPVPEPCIDAMTLGAYQCRAVNAAKVGLFAEAAAQFEKVAERARAESEPPMVAARALAAAGNMWIAAGEPGKAALALDRALEGDALKSIQRGEALLDRARAAEAQNDLKTARAKANLAAESIAEDPFCWYFSAALAIREGDKATAQASINRALALAPTDPTILFEAGHVAHFAGDERMARAHWSQADRYDTNGPIGKAAREAMAMLAPMPADGDAGPPEKPR